MSNLIEPDEMEKLTGAKVGTRQCEVLRTNGIRFTVRADGRPSLSWEAYNRQLASNATTIVGHSEPNLRAV